MGEKPVVAFLGPKASYTHQATLSSFPEQEFSLRPQPSIEDVFAAVQSRAAAHGVVPFENSSNGSVIFTLDLFADANARYPDILVDAEIYLPVRHCLLGHAPRPAARRTDLPWRKPECPPAGKSPAQDVGHVKKLYSHPQAWGQCKNFLTAQLKGVERQDVSSTSRAAELVAGDESGTSAAISSRIAATMNGLEVLAEGIEDVEGNSTRFFVLRRNDAAPRQPVVEWEGRFKTLIAFTVSHEAPGALAEALAVLKTHCLNMTNFTSRPSGEAPWHYIFFVEFNGRKRGEGEGGAVNEALEELGRVAQSRRWLGSWENQLKVKGVD